MVCCGHLMWLIMLRLPPTSPTDCALQCPADDYGVRRPTMYLRLYGPAVTYHVSPGTYIYILVTSSWCMWCIFHLRSALALLFIDKTSQRAFKTPNCRRSAACVLSFACSFFCKGREGIAQRGLCVCVCLQNLAECVCVCFRAQSKCMVA